jgi:glycylpeptide N-tetradecanoyltransferase
MKDPAQAKELYDLLTNHYVEDDGGNFRFDYSVEFLTWALTPPGYKNEWNVGVRGGKQKRLYGFISGIPVHISTLGQTRVMAEINFLCVHKQLRQHRLAPVLIKEITRRVNVCDIWQAIYTSGTTLPTPFGSAVYWHRNLNP